MPSPAGNPTNIALLHAARAGDREALAALLARLRAQLLDRIRLMMGERARAHAESADFLQTTFAAVVQRIDLVEVRDDQSLLRWMTWIARNAIRDDVRGDRDAEFDARSIVLAECASGSSSSPSRATPSKELQRTELVLAVTEALEELPQDQRTVVCLRDFDGLSFREIGQRVGSSEDRVRALYRRALVRLGQTLRDYSV